MNTICLHDIPWDQTKILVKLIFWKIHFIYYILMSYQEPKNAKFIKFTHSLLDSDPNSIYWFLTIVIKTVSLHDKIN